MCTNVAHPLRRGAYISLYIVLQIRYTRRTTMKYRNFLLTFVLAALLGGVAPCAYAGSDSADKAEETVPGFSEKLRTRAQEKLQSLGIEEDEYNEKLQEVIGKDSKKDRRLAKLLIMAGADMDEHGGDYLKKAAAHADVVKLLKKAGAKKESSVSVVGKKLADLDYLTSTRPEPDAKIYMYLFSASWCGPCRMVMPKIVESYSEMKSNGVEIVLMGAEAPDGVKKYLEHYNAKFAATMGQSEKNAQLPGFRQPRGIPFVIVVSGKGDLIHAGHGSDALRWKDFLQKLPAEE